MAAHSPDELHALLETAFNMRDVEAILGLYEEDAVQVVPPTGEHVIGRDALRAALEPIIALRPEARMDVVGKLQRDGLALTYGRWQLNGTDPEGNPVQLAGRGTMVSRMQSDGSWRIALDNPMPPH